MNQNVSIFLTFFELTFVWLVKALQAEPQSPFPEPVSSPVQQKAKQKE